MSAHGLSSARTTPCAVLLCRTTTFFFGFSGVVEANRGPLNSENRLHRLGAFHELSVKRFLRHNAIVLFPVTMFVVSHAMLGFRPEGLGLARVEAVLYCTVQVKGFQTCQWHNQLSATLRNVQFINTIIQ
jgi:hypothetical protein